MDGPHESHVGKYELLQRLAVGGMAELFLARTTGLQGFEKIVVLKRILPHLAGNADFVEMFLHEARLAATLEHPNVVHVSDFGQAGRDYFFVMAYVHGKDLLAILRAAYASGQRLPLSHAITITTAIAAGLHYAHEHVGFDGRPLGIVHRDISPANVLVTFDGHVKVVDFGIAKAAAQTSVTRVGVRKGKAAYMSPEQCRGREVDRRSDLFSIGVVLWEMTTMSRLYHGTGDLALMNQIVHEDARAPSTVVDDYPPALEAIVMRCLRRDPTQRFQTARQLQLALEDFAHEHRLHSSTGALAQYLQELFPADVRALPWAGVTGELTGSPTSAAEVPTRAEPLPTDLPTQAEAPHGPATAVGEPPSSPAVGSVTGSTIPAFGPPSMAAAYAAGPGDPAALGPPSSAAALPPGGFSGPAIHTELHRPQRSVARWALPGALLGALVGVAGWRVWLLAGPLAEPPHARPEPTPHDVEAMLVLVDQADPALALDYPQRHALLQQLRAQPSVAARIDEPLAHALDLRQAAQAPDPCAVFEHALAKLEAAGTAAREPTGARVPAPTVATMVAEARVPAPACAALEPRREALARALHGGRTVD